MKLVLKANITQLYSKLSTTLPHDSQSIKTQTEINYQNLNNIFETESTKRLNCCGRTQSFGHKCSTK
jgi:hypothetical protein